MPILWIWGSVMHEPLACDDVSTREGIRITLHYQDRIQDGHQFSFYLF